MVASTKTLKFMSAGVFRNKINYCSKETETVHHHILMMYSNDAINISVIIGSMLPAFTKTLQFISVTVLKIIFKRHTGKVAPWTHGLDAWTLGLLDSGRLGAWTLDVWNLDARKLGLWRLSLWALARLDSGRLYGCTLDVWTLR